MLRGRTTTRDPRPRWLLLLTAGAVIETGQRATSWWSEQHQAFHSRPAFAALHCLAVILLGTAVLLMRARTPDRSAVRRAALDAATMLVSVVLVVGSVVVSDLVAAGVTDQVTFGMSAAADAALVIAGLAALSRARFPGGAGMRTLLPVAAAVVVTAAGDVAGLHRLLAAPTSSIAVANALLLIGLILLAVAAVRGDTADEVAAMPRRERIAVSAALFAVVPAALVVAGLQVTADRMPVAAIVCVTVLATTLLARLVVALLDNLTLSRTLESQVAARTLELVTREQWFRSLVQHSSDALTVVDPSGVIRYQSPAAEQLFGCEPTTAVGKPLHALLLAEDRPQLDAALALAAAQPGQAFVLEFGTAGRDGAWRETETLVTSLVDVPDVRGIVLTTRDVTERHQLQERLTHQAYYDALTGLANRSLFQHELGTSLRNAAPGTVAVLFCDLDGFKAVNDAQGHDVGDSLLGIVAERLRGCIRPDDMVARFGGDEFAVLVRDPDAMSVAAAVAERVTRSLRRPIRLDGREARVGVSIGIAGVAADGTTVDVLLRNADLAMYRAKADRHQSVVVFEPSMHDALVNRLQVEDDLRVALGNGQLVLHYQPTVSLATGLAVGVEALMRWYHPERGIVAPDEFIEIAEDNGFIDAMGQWALFEACQQAAAWQRFARPGVAFSVGVNISAQQVRPALVELVTACVAEAGIPPGALLLEMTESVLLGRTDEAVEVLQALKRLGVRIAIDDFGTGFSSLSNLARFPVDVLKIDKGFIDAVDGDGERAELVRTIIGLGRSLRVATIAEGVERRQQSNALRAMGCEFGQGYLFSRPLPAHGITALLSGTATADPVPVEVGA